VKTLKILIQDGDADIRSILKMALEQNGFTVSAIGSYEDILPIIDTEKPGLVILDFKLDGHACISAYALIRSLYPGLPVIIMSCNSDIDRVCKQHGFYDFIRKPFDIDEFERICRNYI
jgi:two-component system, NtrC family, nitrogen regulation response regulator GlnG